ncbi:MAG: energy transducer TonB [Candidatus Acidiferrum sp.]
MSIEPGPGSNPSPQNDFGSLQGCFVEGSLEQRARERRIRRRALTISIAIQCAIVTAIVLVPLFGKPERLAFAMIPIPPYYHSNAPERSSTPPHPQARHVTVVSDRFFSMPNRFPQNIDERPEPASPQPPGIPSGPGPGVPCAACVPLADNRPQPVRPVDVRPRTPQVLRMTHLEPAMLIQRVEPRYPQLAIQIHREGRVELHALIATDGTIESLQVVNGDPLFLQSALDAVRQWRYRPTVLNGQPVEIDTYITVIYSLQQ